ncbi:E3 ubiquitin-protein ligase TRIM39-like [Amia ocellicauda]|uniref:E3 ubiquitin-protein ligase TRIM39-like n=1 Tax=Amia ocellicauda TaxID=2972642 RepID=UPI003463B04F
MNDLLKKIEEGIIERLSLLESLNRATETARLSVEEEKGGCIQALEQLEAGVATLREQLGSLIEEMEGEREREAGEMRQRLETEMEELRERGRKLKELQSGDSLQGVQSVSPPPVCQLVSVSLGAVTSALTSITTEFQRLCREELNAAIRPVRVFAFNPVKTALTGLDYVSMYATDVRVDPASAHPCLIVSPDGKSLRTGPRRQPLPPSPPAPQPPLLRPCVLCVGLARVHQGLPLLGGGGGPQEAVASGAVSGGDLQAGAHPRRGVLGAGG